MKKIVLNKSSCSRPEIIFDILDKVFLIAIANTEVNHEGGQLRGFPSRLSSEHLSMSGPSFARRTEKWEALGVVERNQVINLGIEMLVISIKNERIKLLIKKGVNESNEEQFLTECFKIALTKRRI